MGLPVGCGAGVGGRAEHGHFVKVQDGVEGEFVFIDGVAASLFISLDEGLFLCQSANQWVAIFVRSCKPGEEYPGKIFVIITESGGLSVEDGCDFQCVLVVEKVAVSVVVVNKADLVGNGQIRI